MGERSAGFLYQVTLPPPRQACFGIITDDLIQARVVEAAPIGRWMRGKRLSFIISWVEKKGGTVHYVGSAS